MNQIYSKEIQQHNSEVFNLSSQISQKKQQKQATTPNYRISFNSLGLEKLSKDDSIVLKSEKVLHLPNINRTSQSLRQKSCVIYSGSQNNVDYQNIIKYQERAKKIYEMRVHQLDKEIKRMQFKRNVIFEKCDEGDMVDALKHYIIFGERRNKAYKKMNNLPNIGTYPPKISVKSNNIYNQYQYQSLPKISESVELTNNKSSVRVTTNYKRGLSNENQQKQQQQNNNNNNSNVVYCANCYNSRCNTSQTEKQRKNWQNCEDCEQRQSEFEKSQNENENVNNIQRNFKNRIKMGGQYNNQQVLSGDDNSKLLLRSNSDNQIQQVDQQIEQQLQQQQQSQYFRKNFKKSMSAGDSFFKRKNDLPIPKYQFRLQLPEIKLKKRLQDIQNDIIKKNQMITNRFYMYLGLPRPPKYQSK